MPSSVAAHGVMCIWIWPWPRVSADECGGWSPSFASVARAHPCVVPGPLDGCQDREGDECSYASAPELGHASTERSRADRGRRRRSSCLLLLFASVSGAQHCRFIIAMAMPTGMVMKPEDQVVDLITGAARNSGVGKRNAGIAARPSFGFPCELSGVIAGGDH